MSCDIIQYCDRSVPLTLNSTVRMPPRTKDVSLLLTGRYSGKVISTIGAVFLMPSLTIEEIRLQVHIEDVSAKTLDSGVVKRKYVNVLPILNVEALVHVNEVSELYLQVVAGHCVDLDAAFLYAIRAEANENGVAAFFITTIKIGLVGHHKWWRIAYRVMMASPRNNWSTSIVTVATKKPTSFQYCDLPHIRARATSSMINCFGQQKLSDRLGKGKWFTYDFFGRKMVF